MLDSYRSANAVFALNDCKSRVTVLWFGCMAENIIDLVYDLVYIIQIEVLYDSC